ncbi:hypothetical protein FE391_18165 [Nonomuraea sp. KC401]|uniref:TrmO family methyltransferase domain-containing protein n=1 Tax=unclassified Nonomuraea TaxID=2593643 RepID=UPI0010FD128E|nr:MULTISPECIES: TrmO family methyltransferase [unclassified Nonomuraea]TLF71885.1 hypothetical protein FE391_18165 [Nonomuraea sp. KC401]
MHRERRLEVRLGFVARREQGVATLAVDGLDIHVRGLDAIDGTPVLDIRPDMTEFGPQGETVQPAWATEPMRDHY